MSSKRNLSSLDTLVLATQNRDKIREINKLLSGLDVTIRTLDEFPDAPEVVEDGVTLAENSLKKAKTSLEFTGLPSVADDTGLEVDYLNNAPGVYSSRYSGENATYAENVDKILDELQGVCRENRKARFKTIVALCTGNAEYLFEGVCEGIIAEERMGNDGFGYDPVFFVPELNQTFAQMPLTVKNQISHRAKAFLKLNEFLLRSNEVDLAGRSAVR